MSQNLSSAAVVIGALRNNRVVFSRNLGTAEAIVNSRLNKEIKRVYECCLIWGNIKYFILSSLDINSSK